MSTDTLYVDRVGRFRCKVEEPRNGWLGEAGENNTPYIRIPLTVISEGDQEGKEIIFQAWLTDAAFDRTVANLVEVFGWNGDLAALDNGSSTFAGMECEITTESETFEGKTRIKAKWLNPVGGGGGKKMEPDKVKDLINRLGRKAQALAKGAKPAAGATPKPSPKPAPSPAAKPPLEAEDDDIPF